MDVYYYSCSLVHPNHYIVSCFRKHAFPEKYGLVSDDGSKVIWQLPADKARKRGEGSDNLTGLFSLQYVKSLLEKFEHVHCYYFAVVTAAPSLSICLYQSPHHHAITE